MNNAHKLTEHCATCIINDCRFKNDPDRYECNCPSDPFAHIYSVRPTPLRQDRQKNRANHHKRN